jgi:hypothetical protein
MKDFLVSAAVKDGFSLSMLTGIAYHAQQSPEFAVDKALDPIPQTGDTPNTAPYVHAFNCYPVDPDTAAQNRIMLSEYFYALYEAGNSLFWVYDITGPTWDQMFDGSSGQLALPRNPMNIINAAVDEDDTDSLPYLLASDWDNDKTAAGTTNITLLEMDSSDNYSVVTSLPYIYPSAGDYAHCQKVIVTKDQNDTKRIFALFTIMDETYSSYQGSVLKEVSLTFPGGVPTLDFVGNEITTLGAYARDIVPVIYDDGNTSSLKLLIPSIGGPVSTSDQGNGAASLLQMVDASTSGTFAAPVDLLNGADSTLTPPTIPGQDISGVAVSSNGTVIILTTLYATKTDLRAKLYQTNLALLMAITTVEPITDWGRTPIKDTYTRNSFFSALGVGRPDGATQDYFVYVYGTRPLTYTQILPADEMVIWGENNSIASGTIITTDELSFNTSTDVTGNAMVINVAGGLPPSVVRSVHAGAIGAPTPQGVSFGKKPEKPEIEPKKG